MREHKFRGKRCDNGEWVFGDLIQHDGCCGKGIFIKDCSDEYLVDARTVGKYTGINTRGAKDIFEGDIVRLKFGTGMDGFKSTKYKYFECPIVFRDVRFLVL